MCMCIFRVELKYSLSHSLALVGMFYHSNRKKSKVWAFLSLLWRHQWPHNMKAVNSNRLGGNQGSEENQLKAFWASSPSGHIQVEQPWASRSAFSESQLAYVECQVKNDRGCFRSTPQTPCLSGLSGGAVHQHDPLPTDV